ncbi:MAG: cation:proton antiporter domain-containing protein [Promethearchaeota archaeon]
MLDIYQLVYTAFILLFFGSLAYYFASKWRIPRVAIILILGFVCGITGILNRDWFYTFDDNGTIQDDVFPLGTLVEFILIIVLFFGGYSIDIKSLKGILRPGILLATLGAFIVAGIVALMLNFVFPTLFGGITALIIGSLIAPNDPIAVTSTQSTFNLNSKADTISKFESGLDDTMVTTLILLICIPLAFSMENFQTLDIASVIIPGILEFTWYTASAIVIGLILGNFFCVIYVNIKNKEIRMLVNVLLPFITFILATIENSHTGMPISSGFVSVFVAGLTFGREILKNEKEGI